MARYLSKLARKYSVCMVGLHWPGHRELSLEDSANGQCMCREVIQTGLPMARYCSKLAQMCSVCIMRLLWLGHREPLHEVSADGLFMCREATPTDLGLARYYSKLAQTYAVYHEVMPIWSWRTTPGS